jgi:hypothetical protein
MVAFLMSRKANYHIGSTLTIKALPSERGEFLAIVGTASGVLSADLTSAGFEQWQPDCGSHCPSSGFLGQHAV